MALALPNISHAMYHRLDTGVLKRRHFAKQLSNETALEDVNSNIFRLLSACHKSISTSSNTEAGETIKNIDQFLLGTPSLHPGLLSEEFGTAAL